MLRLRAILLASLPALASFPEAVTGFTARAFITAGRYVTSPVTSCHQLRLIIPLFRASLTDGVP